jgi:hypothetical protein
MIKLRHDLVIIQAALLSWPRNVRLRCLSPIVTGGSEAAPESLDRAQRLVDQALGIVRKSPLLLATKGRISWHKSLFATRDLFPHLS